MMMLAAAGALQPFGDMIVVGLVLAMAAYGAHFGLFLAVLAGMHALVSLVVALAFALERFWALRRQRVMPDNLVSQLPSAPLSELRGACQAQPSPLSRLVLSILDHVQWPKEENVAALQVQARREVLRLERGLVVLEIIVGIAPLLGLVGTIYAIIPLFGDFGRAMAGDNALLAKGIGAALNKTLLGLMVAIPSLVALDAPRASEHRRLHAPARCPPRATS
mgnify:CR=1 FL=1